MEAAAAVGTREREHARGVAGGRHEKLLQPRAYLVESIVAPNATVAEAYRTTVILTEEGQTVGGILLSEDANTVKLTTADGTIKSVAVASIDERTSRSSSMPADLVGKLTHRELRELIAWWRS